ncbi:MAG: hypothetical protein HN348_19035, partial [Proteobacteria bacterium]|nr:hypothetical protein [Pseudomonadota bacterium]
MLELTVHSDESGGFRGECEPYVMAAIAHRTGCLELTEAAELWSSLELGPPDKFHATESSSAAQRETLNDRAAHLAKTINGNQDSKLIALFYQHRRGRTLLRQDVYLDMVVHLAVHSARWFVHRAVRDSSWSGLVPLKVELNLARRFALNLQPL